MEKKDTYWKEASSVFREWKSGKVSLVDLTDGRLQMLDDYLTLFVSVRYAPQTDQLQLKTPRRKMRFSLRWIALIPAGFVFLMLIYSMIRGL